MGGCFRKYVCRRRLYDWLGASKSRVARLSFSLGNCEEKNKVDEQSTNNDEACFNFPSGHNP